MSGILVVEDEPLIASLVEEWLTELDCKVIGPVSSVKAALSAIDSVALEGAILDLSLGSEDTFSVADNLFKRGVPFAFATGYPDEDVAVRFPNALILRKPFTLDDLRATIARFRGA